MHFWESLQESWMKVTLCFENGFGFIRNNIISSQEKVTSGLWYLNVKIHLQVTNINYAVTKGKTKTERSCSWEATYMYLDGYLYHTICWATFWRTLYKTNIHLGVGGGEGRFGQILCYFNKNVVKSTLCLDTLIRWTPRNHVLPRVGPCLFLLLFRWLSLRQTSSWDGHWVPVQRCLSTV